MTSGTLKLHDWYRGFVRGKTRVTLAWLFAAVLIFCARDYPTWPGIGLCFAGAALRYWASGFLRKDTKPAVGGPYALTRNPLYLGTYLMALGTALAIENWLLLAVLSLAFAIIYHFVILDEEEKLQKLFGKPYELYCETVPRFFPAIWFPSRRLLNEVNPNQNYRRFDAELAKKNKAHEAFLAFAGLIGFVTLIAFLWKTLL